MKKLIAFLAVATFTLANETISGFASPESVYVDNNNVYVSNVGTKLAPTQKDGDGFISKLSKDGKVIKKDFITGLNAPKGMAEVDGILYVADIDNLVGFDLENGKEVFKLPINGALFLNDITPLNKNTLFISDTGTGIIHKVNLKKHTYKEFVKFDIADLGGPNGLLLDKKAHRLLVAGYNPDGTSGGKIVGIDLKTKKITPLMDKKEQFDGIAFDKNKNIIVSSWGDNLQGVLYEITKNGNVLKFEMPYIKGPADIFIDKTNTLWIPKMVENKVLKVKL